MYKCKECGAKYEIKPDYCECGNDTFVKVLSANSAANIKLPEQKSQQDDFDSNLEDFRQTEIPNETNYKDGFNELSQPSNDKVSVGIFALCIFLAFLVLFFIGNPKKETETDEQKTQTVAQTPKDIPSLDSFWDNTTVKVEIKQPEPEEQKPTVEIPIVAELPKIVQQIIPQPKPQESKPVTKNTTMQKTTQQTQKTKTTTATKTTTPAKTTSTTATKPATNTAKPVTVQTPNLITQIKNTQTAQTPKTTQTTTAQQAPAQAPKPNTTTQTTTAQNTQAQQVQQQAALEAQRKAAAAQAAAQAAKQAAAAKQELANYKTSLRNSIGRKIDFTSVVGDGSCSLSFKIASNGRLTNRVFTKQSSNLTLNEAVYSAMNATPSYNPPPSAYNNETLNLTIKFYNGNFEISLN